MKSGNSDRGGVIGGIPHPASGKPPGVSHADWFDGGGASIGWYVNAGRRADLPVVSGNVRIQASYVAMRLDGQSHNMANMLAHREPPMSNTDREFLEGMGGCYDQFGSNPVIGATYEKMARAAGVSTTGQVYVSGLATYPGDPMAWVGGRGDVERVARLRGFSVDGSVKVRPDGRWDEGPKDIGVADDLVQSRVAERTEADPSLGLRDRGEVFHETREMMKPHWD